MPEPFITVLMTVYNAGDYLAPAIRSVLSQDFADFEFLIVDDGSTDASVSVVRSFNDQRIRLIINDSNIGQTASLNAGLREARGAYVARIDADDIALAGWLSAQAVCARLHPACAVVSLPVVLIDPAGRVQKSGGTFSSAGEVCLRALTHSPINHGGCLMKRAQVAGAGGYDGVYRIAADYALWSTLLREGHCFVSSTHPGMAIRVHSTSLSRASRETLKAEMEKIMAENIRFFTEISDPSKVAADLWPLFYDIDSLSCAQRHAAEEVFARAVISRKSCLNIPDALCRRYIAAIRRENDLRVLFRAWDRSPALRFLPRVFRCLLRFKAVAMAKRGVVA